MVAVSFFQGTITSVFWIRWPAFSTAGKVFTRIKQTALRTNSQRKKSCYRCWLNNPTRASFLSQTDGINFKLRIGKWALAFLWSQQSSASAEGTCTLSPMERKCCYPIFQNIWFVKWSHVRSTLHLCALVLKTRASIIFLLD